MTTKPVAPITQEDIIFAVRRALDEDFCYGPDITTRTIIDPQSYSRAAIVARHSGIICGIDCAMTALNLIADNGTITIDYTVADGTKVDVDQVVMEFTAVTSDILEAERTMLNFLTHLSGIATQTSLWVAQIAHTTAHIRDTRKTLPGLRALEKYAVYCGGGINHRFSLGDAILIKDNHIQAAGSVLAAWDAVQAVGVGVPIEVEVDTLEQFDEMLHVDASCILLDNFPLRQTQIAVARRDQYYHKSGHRALLESSGGITFDTVGQYAATGVDYIAVGALTHSPQALDIGLDFL